MASFAPMAYPTMESGIHAPMSRPSPPSRPLPCVKVKKVRQIFSAAPQVSQRPLPVGRSRTQTQTTEKKTRPETQTYVATEF